MTISSTDRKFFVNFNLCPNGLSRAELCTGNDEWEEVLDLGVSYEPWHNAPTEVTLGQFVFDDKEEFSINIALPVKKLLASRVGSWMIPTDTVGGYTIQHNLLAARAAIIRLAHKLDEITKGGEDIHLEAWRLEAKTTIKGEIDSWSIRVYKFNLCRENQKLSRITTELYRW